MDQATDLASRHAACLRLGWTPADIDTLPPYVWAWLRDFPGRRP